VKFTKLILLSTILFSTSTFAATQLILKEQIPNSQVADFAESTILSKCQPAADHSVELKVFRYDYRKIKSDSGQVTLLHDVIVMFDYKGLYEDYVKVTVAESYPQTEFSLFALEHPSICQD